MVTVTFFECRYPDKALKRTRGCHCHEQRIAGQRTIMMGVAGGIPKRIWSVQLRRLKVGKKAEVLIQVRRVYDPKKRGDGTRVLVDRIWPRGLTKPKAELDE